MALAGRDATLDFGLISYIQRGYMRWMLSDFFWCALLVATFSVPPLPAADLVPRPTFKQVRIGKAIVSLPSDASTFSEQIPVWLHLHGAPGLVENNFASAGAPGVLANITLPGLSKVYADHFAEVTVLETLLNDIEAAVRLEYGSKVRGLGRLTVSSFSAGFGGVRQLLRQPRAFERIDRLVMLDSIYCGYTGDIAERRVDGELMSGFLRFARLASEGKKRFLITHSRQIPEGYASTTETADFLITALSGTRTLTAGEEDKWPAGLRLQSRFTRGRFLVLGFEGEAPEDHMRHLRAIAAFVDRSEKM
jgi:hypothetical protein